MDFHGLQSRLLDEARRRVLNGETSERALARNAGISQPHLHNALKGARALSPELADRLLTWLGLTIADLLSPGERAVLREASGRAPDTPVEILDGWVGPGWPWPQAIHPGRMQVPAALLEGVEKPVLARLAPDAALEGMLRPGQLALLDTAARARGRWIEDAWYAVVVNREGRIRRVAEWRGKWHLALEVGSPPAPWAKLEGIGGEAEMREAVRARVAVLDVAVRRSVAPKPPGVAPAMVRAGTAAAGRAMG